MNNTIQDFSAGYFVLDVNTVTHTGDDVIVADDYFRELSRHTTHPLLRVSNAHHWPSPERAVPAETIALPESADTTADSTPILLAKDETAKRLVETGEKELPNQ
jgi:hypothetical protein